MYGWERRLSIYDTEGIVRTGTLAVLPCDPGVGQPACNRVLGSDRGSDQN